MHSNTARRSSGGRFTKRSSQASSGRGGLESATWERGSGLPVAAGGPFATTVQSPVDTAGDAEGDDEGDDEKP